MLSYAFVAKSNYLQFLSSFLSLFFSLYSFAVLFYAHKENKTWYINYLAWLCLVVVLLLEVIFLISLLVTGNTYDLIKTSYGTLRIEYVHSGTQIFLVFIMGVVGIFTHLCAAVAAQRFASAIYGK